MDGIFLAYHNTVRFFGFQYLPLYVSLLACLFAIACFGDERVANPLRTELDERLFGSPDMADQAFKLSVSLLEIILKHATACFPDEVSQA
jgi:hypothetical protein